MAVGYWTEPRGPGGKRVLVAGRGVRCDGVDDRRWRKTLTALRMARVQENERKME